ncbi:MAG: AMP-binding protein, partial [Nocardioidaceae bacterium]
MPSTRIRPFRCPAGAGTLDTLGPALDAALAGTGPPLGLLPGDGTGSDLLCPDVPIDADGIAATVTTSGSTGEPKVVLLPEAALRASATATLDRMGGPGQWLLALPTHYVAGLQVLVRAWAAGTTPVVLGGGGFTAASFAAATARLEPGTRRYTALVPTQLNRVLSEAVGREALASYDALLLGGGAAPPGLVDRARAVTTVLTTYGMSETCGGCVYDGVPLAGVSAEIGADGRVRLSGPVLAAGYRLRPDLTAKAFETRAGQRWHVTPDLGRWADDTLQVLGRADDVAVCGGVKVPLQAVEQAVTEHPGLAAGACVAVADAEWGERVVAHVVARSAPPSLEELRDHVARTLPRTWAPRELVVRAELPLL